MSPLKIPLQITCPHCQQGNLPGSPYCSGCGAPLGDAAPGAAAATRTGGLTVEEDPIKRFLSEGQDRLLAKQSYDRAFGVLTTGESIEYVAVAVKASLAHAPDCLVLTNKRIMLLRKKVLGKYELDDCYWRDVRETQVKEGKTGISLTVQAIQGWRITGEALPRAQAWRIVEIAAEHNERIRESLPAHQMVIAAAAATAVAVPATPAPAPGGFSAATTQGAGPAAVPATPSALPNAGAPVAPNTSTVVPGPAPASAGNSSRAGQPDNPAAAPVPMAAAPANDVPTPESVLQTILQQSQAAQDGAPTRPMQFSAAAFQAPAPVDPHPVTFRETDTEPNMRPVPPMPTLEQIAVFSGPLAFNHQYGGDLGPTLNESSSNDLWGADGEQLAIEDAPVAGGLTLQATGPVPTEGRTPDTGSLPTLPPPPPSIQSASSGAVDDVSETHLIGDGSPDYLGPDVSSNDSEPLDLPLDVADLMGYMMASAHDLSGEPLPLPGTLSSGPLLPASQYGANETTSLAQQSPTDTGTLSTQRLYYDPTVEYSDADRPTDINLGQYPVSQPKPAKSGKSSGAATPKSQSPRASGSSGGRSSQSKQPADDPISKMKQLKMLLDAGFINESDYEAKKADILARFF